MRRLNSKEVQCFILLLICSTIASIFLFTNSNATSNKQFELVVESYELGTESKTTRSDRITTTENFIATTEASADSTTVKDEVTQPPLPVTTEVNIPLNLWPNRRRAIPSETLHGFLNVHMWDAWCGKSIQRLRFHKHFPLYPDFSSLANSTYSTLHETQYGQRLFGYIHPPVTGNYVFAMTSDDDSETWLSTSDQPENIQLIVAVNYALEDYSLFGDKKTILHSSNKIKLQRGKKYYIEILHKQYGYKDYILLGWMLPGFKKFKRLHSQYLSTFYDPHMITKENLSLYIPVTNASFNYYSHHHEFNIKKNNEVFTEKKMFLPHEEISNLFPICKYHPSYIIKFNLSRYQGVYLIHETSIYPDDGTRQNGSKVAEFCNKDRLTDSHGNIIPGIAMPPEIRESPVSSSNSTENHNNYQSYNRRTLKSWSIRKAWNSRRPSYVYKEVPKWFGDSEDSYKLPLKTRNISIEQRMYGFKWAYLKKQGKYRDETLYKQYVTICRNDGNVLLNVKVAKFVMRYYMSVLKKKLISSVKLLRIINVEENHDMLLGNRYLVEIDIMKDNKEYRVSDYVYQRQGEVELCRPNDFQWKFNVMVHVIVPVKDQGKWLQHFIHNMDEIYQRTGDNRFSLIIVDFNSTDINIMDYLRKSSLPNYKVVQMHGPFQRALGLQAGADAIKNKDEIIFMCDLHLQIPDSLIENTRKHCIQNKMAYAPMVNRLECGYTPETPRGSWELLGFGLFGMYKSDFDAVGGMNTNEFKTTWGGEDWELVDRVLQHGLEIERMRLPKFYHHYHSKKKMWDNSEKE